MIYTYDHSFIIAYKHIVYKCFTKHNLIIVVTLDLLKRVWLGDTAKNQVLGEADTNLRHKNV